MDEKALSHMRTRVMAISMIGATMPWTKDGPLNCAGYVKPLQGQAHA